jgi:hypothetical protein
VKLTEIRAGDVLETDGTYPEGDPMDAGLVGPVEADGRYLTWRAPFGINIDIPTTDDGTVRGFVRTACPHAFPECHNHVEPCMDLPLGRCNDPR